MLAHLCDSLYRIGSKNLSNLIETVNAKVRCSVQSKRGIVIKHSYFFCVFCVGSLIGSLCRATATGSQKIP